MPSERRPRVSSPQLDSLMARCLILAAKADGATSPNPMVGAVLVKGRRIVAEAWHRKAGGPHAELAALRRAGRSARGATLFVNLEPCSHHGRTPPCTDAIISAGVTHVVAAHQDPNPLVRGRGFAALRRAGVRLTIGPMRAEARLLNERYLVYMTRGRPFVLVKAAVSLDGRIASVTGASRWITSSASRAEAHRMRERHDAVMVGATTARRDDPRLTARRGGRPARRQPIRVVVDRELGLPAGARMLRSGGGPVVVYTCSSSSRARAARLESRGAEIVRVRSGGGSGRPELLGVLADLARRGVTSVMVEGGGELIASTFAAGLVDRVALFVAPLILGGRGAVPLVGGSGARTPAGAVRLGRLSVRRLGPDLLIEGHVIPRGGGGVHRDRH